MIRFNCSTCGKAISVQDEHAGKKGTCSGCGTKTIIPASTAVAKQPSSPIVEQDEFEQPPALVHRTTVRARDKSVEAVAAPGTPVQVNIQTSRGAHSLGVASLILGILSFFVCWMPYIGVGFAGIAFLLGATGLVIAMSRKGTGIGYAIAGTAVSAVGLLLGGIWSLLFTGAMSAGVTAINDAAEQILEQQAIDKLIVRNEPDEADAASDANPLVQPEEKPAADPEPAKPKEPQWNTIESPLRIGNVELLFLRGDVGNVELRRAFGDSESKSKDRLLTVWLKFTNVSEGKKVDYAGYMAPLASLRDIDAELTDDNGNKYRMVNFGASTFVKGATVNESIYPNKSLVDAVVFEEPVDGIKYLRLKLSAKSAGEDGEFRFEIPADILVRE